MLLAELFGVPLPWSGVLVVLGLGWWALLALARPRTGPRTAIVVLALTQLGLVAAIVCGMTAGAPGTDLWPHLQVAGAVAVGLTATLGWAAVGPDPGHTATSVPGQGSEDRRRLDPKRPVIVGLIGVLLITMATLTAPLPRPDPTVAAASYVPRDGAGAAIMWRSSGESSAGQLENRRAEHPAALDERFADVPDPSHGLWWEEWISGGDRRWSIDVDAGSGQVSAEMIDSDRVRLMTVTGQGIELRGMTGLNAGTVLLSPGAVLLPADPDDGSRWRGSGTAELVTTGGQTVPMEFEMSGFIVRGGNALPLVRRAHRTCRVAAIELDLRPTDGSRFAAMTITDQSWWCPDRGVALQYGEVDGSEYMMSQLGDLRMQPGADLDDATRPGGPGVPPIAGELRRTRMICPGGLEIPRIPTRTGRSGDTILPGGHLLSTTVGSPRVSVTDHGLSWWPTSRRDRCQARTPKQHHPGGVVLGAWDMGALIAVASSDATLTAYGTESGRLWQSELSAVPRVAPVRVGSAIAVLGTDDILTLLDFESGEVRAEVAIPGARTVTASTGANLANARAAVADRTGRVSFVSADGTLTGRLRAPAAAEHRMVGIDQPQLVSWTSTGVEVRAQSGTLSWQQDRPIDDLTVLEDSGHGPVLLVRDATGLTALAADSGQVVWTHAPVQQVAPITDGVLLLDDLGVQVLDGLGRVVTTLALPADVPVERITVSATDRIVWIVWTDDAGVTRMTGYLPR
ncbi:MAG TPA: hypothetical protein IAA98_05350 [Candidatus Avipropionibacterium avicola]|uniref:PQQ-like domain-containing protein n=1 Tax=Candidatus Avipropionibacterium avicola TaxID=2840701 RepID=A0A9D1GWY6_9ACTN|nr:hypothetical protein [Candidatus Avipropionibacterium avicola]